MSRKVDVQQIVFIHDTKLLITTVSLLVLTEDMLGTLTFPASLATNALVEFGPSCFTWYVSSSFPSHMIEKFKDSRLKGVVKGRGEWHQVALRWMDYAHWHSRADMSRVSIALAITLPITTNVTFRLRNGRRGRPNTVRGAGTD